MFNLKTGLWKVDGTEGLEMLPEAQAHVRSQQAQDKIREQQLKLHETVQAVSGVVQTETNPLYPSEIDAGFYTHLHQIGEANLPINDRIIAIMAEYEPDEKELRFNQELDILLNSPKFEVVEQQAEGPNVIYAVKFRGEIATYLHVDLENGKAALGSESGNFRSRFGRPGLMHNRLDQMSELPLVPDEYRLLLKVSGSGISVILTEEAQRKVAAHDQQFAGASPHWSFYFEESGKLSPAKNSDPHTRGIDWPTFLGVVKA